MGTRRIRLLGVVSMMALGGVLAACGGSATGRPSPGPSSGGSAAPPPASASAAAPSSGATSLASVKPCSLLTKTQAKQLDMAWPGKVVSGIVSGCTWDQASATRLAFVGVDIFLDKGLADVRANGGTVGKVMMVGRHHARRQRDASACAFALGVTPHSRVDVTGNDTNGEPDCGLAMRAAKLVEKNLPES